MSITVSYRVPYNVSSRIFIVSLTCLTCVVALEYVMFALARVRAIIRLYCFSYARWLARSRRQRRRQQQREVTQKMLPRTMHGNRFASGDMRRFLHYVWKRFRVSTPTSGRLQPRIGGNDARRRNKGRNVSWRNGEMDHSLQRKSGLEYGMQYCSI